MRGSDVQTSSLFSYVDLETRVRSDHPLRAIRLIANEALAVLSPTFSGLYSDVGRASIPPERLLRAMLLQLFYSVRSERQLMERLEFDLLFRWFVGLGVDDPVWDHSVFSKNRERLMDGDIAVQFLDAVMAQPKIKRLLSSEHFTVDGTLIQAWASQKSFRPKDGSDDEPKGGGRNAERNFRGQERKNDTHASTTDPDARLFRKGDGQPAILAYAGHVVIENRNGLVVDARLTQATGTAERDAALDMMGERPTGRRLTLGADKNYDTAAFVKDLRALRVTPHVIQHNNNRRSAIDERTTQYPGYMISLRIRPRIEEVFGWMKTIAGIRQTKYRGRERVGWSFTLAVAAYNLRRIPKLIAAAG